VTYKQFDSADSETFNETVNVVFCEQKIEERIQVDGENALGMAEVTLKVADTLATPGRDDEITRGGLSWSATDTIEVSGGMITLQFLRVEPGYRSPGGSVELERVDGNRRRE